MIFDNKEDAIAYVRKNYGNEIEFVEHRRWWIYFKNKRCEVFITLESHELKPISSKKWELIMDERVRTRPENHKLDKR